jgi:acyl-coenzyme A synthetase/AMP-(fatty) acid ligase
VNAVTLREVLEDGGATAMAITPSHLELINQSGVRRSTMRVVMTAGELLRRATAMRAREIFGPRCRILCQWGPTETTIVNTSHEFDPERDTDAGVPFGRPMDNNTVYLLDSRGRFVSPGEPGEAYVGGVQVARGYLGRPDLTRQRFVRLADGTRVYRTGDIARRDEDGLFHLLGRRDGLVKTRGYRVELGEVEAIIGTHPDVAEVAVLAEPDPELTNRLHALVVPTSEHDGDPALTDRLVRHCRDRLPGYMVPSRVHLLTKLPKTSTGKIARAELPELVLGAR